MLYLLIKTEEDIAMLNESELIYERQRLFHLIQEHPEWSLRAYARTVQHDPKWVCKWAGRIQRPKSLQAGKSLNAPFFAYSISSIRYMINPNPSIRNTSATKSFVRVTLLEKR